MSITTYDKLHKMLRNWIAHTSETVEQIQMEVFVQNSDLFIDIIKNYLIYISYNQNAQSKITSFDLIQVLLQLISKMMKKSKAMKLEVDIH